jgi:hypothetical protein
MIHELLGQLAARKDTFSDNLVSVGQMGELVDMVQCGRMTGVYGVVCSVTVAHVISRAIRKGVVASHGHITLDSFPVDARKRAGSAGGIRRRRVSLAEMVFRGDRGAP